MRKHWIDNLRTFTVHLVVLFHAFFFYNNIFQKVGEGEIATYIWLFKKLGDWDGRVTFAGIYQYAVYPWFMLLLFVLAGMSACYSLRKRSKSDFIHERNDRILAPSTLGVLLIGWIGGLINTIVSFGSAFPIPAEVPDAIRYIGSWIIWTLSGQGAIWFNHVVYVASLILLLVLLIPSAKLEKVAALGSKTNIIILLLFFFPVWGAAQILNMPSITSYRNGIYLLGFFLGYFVFSNDEVIDRLKKWWVLTLPLAIVAGVIYIKKSYGIYYADPTLLKTWHSVLFGWLMALSMIGLFAKFCDRQTDFTKFFVKTNYGLFILHITFMELTAFLLEKLPCYDSMNIWICYIALFVIAEAGSVGAYLVLKRVPIVRYWLFGIRGKKTHADSADNADKNSSNMKYEINESINKDGGIMINTENQKSAEISEICVNKNLEGKLLVIQNLTKTYPKFKLDGVGFEVGEGEIMGFIGRNGAGKTTTIKSMLRFVHPDSGNAIINGFDVQKNEFEAKNSIGYIAGNDCFYGTKKLKTIVDVTKKFYPNWNQELFDDIFERFELDENKLVKNLSAGMKIKFQIALAMSHDAKLLILDEPTSGLDPVSRDELVSLFKDYVKDGKHSILFSTHVTSDLEKCADTITYIKKGKILFTGTREEFINQHGGKTLDEIMVEIEHIESPLAGWSEN